MLRNRTDIPLETSALFAELAPETVNAFRMIATLYRLTPGENLFHQGDTAHSFYVVLEGGVRLVEHTDTGKNVNLKVYGVGDVFGLLAVAGDYVHPAAVQAVSDCVVVGIRGRAARQLMQRYPQFALRVIDCLVDHVHHAHTRIRHLAVEQTQRRLARAVVHFFQKFGLENGSSVSINAKLTQQDVAEFTGTTVETVNRILRAWKKEGIVDLSRQSISLLDVAALQEIAGMELDAKASLFE